MPPNTRLKASSKSNDEAGNSNTDDVTFDYLIEAFHEMGDNYGTDWPTFYYETPIVVIKEARALRQHRVRFGFLNTSELVGLKVYLRTKAGKKFNKEESLQEKLEEKINNRGLTSEEINPNSEFFVDVFDPSLLEEELAQLDGNTPPKDEVLQLQDSVNP